MQYLVYVNGPQYKCQVYHPAWAEGTHSAPARILFLGRIRNKCKEKIPSPQVQRKGWFRIGFDQSDKAYWRTCPEPGLKSCVCVCVSVACMDALSVHRLSWGPWRGSLVWGGAGIPRRSLRTTATASSCCGAFQRGNFCHSLCAESWTAGPPSWSLDQRHPCMASPVFWSLLKRGWKTCS